MKLFVFLLFFLCTVVLKAQKTKEVTIVSESKEPIQFVNIYWAGDKGTVSDAKGTFILNDGINPDSSIVFSHIAYHTKNIQVKNIKDSILLTERKYVLRDIKVTNIDILALLKKALEGIEFEKNANYRRIKLIALGDSLVFYSEKEVKLTKINPTGKTLMQKTIAHIEYNVASKDFYNVSFPFSQTLLKSPFVQDGTKSKIDEFQGNTRLTRETDNYYFLEVQDSTSNVGMYITKDKGRLVRFEKTFHPKPLPNGVKFGNTSFFYEFAYSKSNKVSIENFKYYTKVCPPDTTSCFDLIISDKQIKDTGKKNTLIFKTLDDLKNHKQGEQVIDADLYKFFKLTILGYTSQNIPINCAKGAIYTKMDFDFSNEVNFMAIFNHNEMKYSFYPSGNKINFDLNSSLVSNQLFVKKNKIDSFNPYGVYKPSDALFNGLFNSVLDIFQKQ